MPKQIITLNTIPNMIFFVILIVGIGAVFGMLTYEVFETNKKIVFVNEIQKDNVNVLDKDKYFGNDFIQIKFPQKNTAIKSPVLISGEANVFEANVRIKIKDENGNVLANSFITAGGWMDAKYPFEKEIDYTFPTSPNGIIEVFEEDTKNGNEIHKVTIPIAFLPIVSENHN
ncbi:MAG: Gmad2 immunoglobulin-like domain-containing protein [Patescibacteria group bacterium]|nr:Gmad2 immunoglobulin-like domain-containing protein [Patescibacteria group bacterium]